MLLQPSYGKNPNELFGQSNTKGGYFKWLWHPKLIFSDANSGSRTFGIGASREEILLGLVTLDNERNSTLDQIKSTLWRHWGKGWKGVWRDKLIKKWKEIHGRCFCIGIGGTSILLGVGHALSSSYLWPPEQFNLLWILPWLPNHTIILTAFCSNHFLQSDVHEFQIISLSGIKISHLFMIYEKK